MNTPLLNAKNLSKSFGDLKAVCGVDISISAGECLALLGPNGAGKTTTVEMLEGLLEPDGGTIEIFGASLRDDRDAIIQKIGVLLQETNLYKKLKVRETLQLFASFFQKSRDPETIMNELNLQEKAETFLENLSGGQKQRVYLGCAVINDPDLIFLDEPTTGLDPQARRNIWELLLGLKAAKKSILLTTHYMEEAEQLADRVGIIDHGKIIALDSPQALIEQHCGEQVIFLQMANRDSAEAAAKVFGEQFDWFTQPNILGNSLELSTNHAAERVTNIHAAAKSAGIKIDSLQIRRSSLEDVFLKLTGRSMRDG